MDELLKSPGDFFSPSFHKMRVNRDITMTLIIAAIPCHWNKSHEQPAWDGKPGNECMEGCRQWANQTRGFVKWKLGDWRLLLKRPTRGDAHSVHISVWLGLKQRGLFRNRCVSVLKSNAAPSSVCEGSYWEGSLQNNTYNNSFPMLHFYPHC